MNNSILFLTDSYKVSHHKQYPVGTEKVYSYLESRGGKFPKTLFFGLQYLLKEYLAGVRVTSEDITGAVDFYRQHFGYEIFNEEGWRYIVEHHNGILPVSIKAVPEGTVVDNRNVLMTIENTDPNVPWLTNFLETLLVQVWYPTTVATLSFYMKDMIGRHMDRTARHREGLEFKLHDFGFRGVSSVESAGIGGAAHLINFRGTDTIAAIQMARHYYGADMCGFSIPASEHSTITSWGKAREALAMENMLDQYPEGLVACVSDSYDIYGACREIWGERLREKVLGRNGTLVVRPDSGDPPVVVGEILKILGQKFGSERNAAGYRVLPPQIRVIQGDGIDICMARQVLTTMELAGWSAENIAFGMGGALLQKLNRDTQKFAFKCSEVVVNGERREVFKDPVDDPGKSSKRGRLKLVTKGEQGEYPTYLTLPEDSTTGEDQLVEVFRDGKILKQYSFQEIIDRVAQAEV